MIPGEIIPAGEPVTVNEGLPVTTLEITNTGLVPIHLTAHFHVFEANRYLRFDRRKAFGMRLDVHVKGAVRFLPGETRQVELVPIGGKRVIYGFNDAVNGRLDNIDPGEAARRLAERGFLDLSTQDAN
jgi:urease subunit beta